VKPERSFGRELEERTAENRWKISAKEQQIHANEYKSLSIHTVHNCNKALNGASRNTKQ
jgi:hypothetical protein